MVARLDTLTHFFQQAVVRHICHSDEWGVQVCYILLASTKLLYLRYTPNNKEPLSCLSLSKSAGLSQQWIICIEHFWKNTNDCLP